MTTPDQLRELLATLNGLQSTVAQALQAPASTSDDPLVDLLARSQALVLAHPAESAGLVQGLAAIGRRHAATPEGAELLRGLLASAEVAELIDECGELLEDRDVTLRPDDEDELPDAPRIRER